MSSRMLQINKESKIIIGIYLFYFLWWYFFAYGSGDDPTKYTYILGLPSWFFMSCIVGFVTVVILLSLAIKYFFKDIELGDE